MMKEKLPKGWRKVSISNIGKVVTGNTPSKGNSEYFNGNIPWVKPGDVKKGRVIFKTEETLTEFGIKKARIIPKGSVIVTCIGDLGNVAIAGMNLASNQQINSIIVNEEKADQKYIYYWSLTLKSWLIQNSTSTTISMVNKSKFENAPVILPPIPEQLRIVAKLDALFGHLDSLREKLNRIPGLLKNFRQQVLTQAVTGELNKTRFNLRQLHEFGVSIKTGPFGSSLHKNEYVNDGIPVINPSHILGGRIIPDPKISISADKLIELKQWKLDEGDVIIGRRGEMGRAAKYSSDQKSMICGTGSLVIKPGRKIHSDFLSIYLRSEIVVNFLNKNSVGSTMINLNQKVVKSIPFPMIELNEQEKVVLNLVHIFNQIDKIESHYQSLKAKIDQMPQAILAKAFRGELVEKEVVKGYEVEEGEGLMAAEPGQRFLKK